MVLIDPAGVENWLNGAGGWDSSWYSRGSASNFLQYARYQMVNWRLSGRVRERSACVLSGWRVQARKGARQIPGRRAYFSTECSS